jgi:hypothetical protein
MIKYCDRCNTRYIVTERDQDFIHECNSGNAVLDQEDLALVETQWTDYTGTDTPLLSDARNRALVNKLKGSRAGVEGDKVGNFTRRGNNADTTRTRQHLHFIKIKED